MASHVGGQAVIEGVMMRNNEKVATAVRLANGKIRIKKDTVPKRSRIWKLPLFRGIINLWDMLILGMKTLIWSADQQLGKKEKISKKELFFSLSFAFITAIGLFVALPYFLAGIFGVKEQDSPIIFNLIDGILRALFVIIYILAISMMKDVRRLFEYHGAEHKAVFCYEAKKSLTFENVKKFSTKHPRCGTSFIFLVLLISIIIFSVIPSLAKLTYPAFIALAFIAQKMILFGIRILFIPVIAGVAYEALKLTAKYPKNIFVKIIAKPGLLFQNITTKEPDKKQIEVAVKALKKVL
jgi:uncharacterized protein YqhQ